MSPFRTKNRNALVQSIYGGHPEGEKRTLSQITTPEGWKHQNPEEGVVIHGPDGQIPSKNMTETEEITIPEGGKNPNPDDGDVMVSHEAGDEMYQQEGNEHSRRLDKQLEKLIVRWKETEYRIFLEALEQAREWPEEVNEVRDNLVEWMINNRELRLV